MGNSSSTPEAALACCPCCNKEVSLAAYPPADELLCPHCHYRLWFLRKEVGEAVVVTFLPVVQSNAQTILRAGEVVEAAGESSLLVLDLSQMPLVQSVLLGVLVAVRRQLQEAKTRLRVCGLRAEARDTFQATQLYKLFEVCDDQRTALAALERRT